jgi:hypothetical protein
LPQLIEADIQPLRETKPQGWTRQSIGGRRRAAISQRKTTAAA